MAIGEFGPEEISRMQQAYEKATKRLNLTDQFQVLGEVIARQIVEAAEAGETDPNVMAERALVVATKHERYIGRRKKLATGSGRSRDND